MESNNLSGLSSNLRQMKFMMRGKVLSQDENLSDNLYTNDHWVLDLPKICEKENKYVVNCSLSENLELAYGRLSYQGFNKATEKIMRSLNKTDDENDSIDTDGSISDEEMTERFSSVVGTVSRRFNKIKTMKHKLDESVDEAIESKYKKLSGEIDSKGFIKPRVDDE